MAKRLQTASPELTYVTKGNVRPTVFVSPGSPSSQLVVTANTSQRGIMMERAEQRLADLLTTQLGVPVTRDHLIVVPPIIEGTV